MSMNFLFRKILRTDNNQVRHNLHQIYGMSVTSYLDGR